MVCHLQNDGSGVCMCRSSFAEQNHQVSKTTRSHCCYYTHCAEEAVVSQRGQSFLGDSRDRKWCCTLWMRPRLWAQRPFLAFVAHLTSGLASSDPAQDDKDFLRYACFVRASQWFLANINVTLNHGREVLAISFKHNVLILRVRNIPQVA